MTSRVPPALFLLGALVAGCPVDEPDPRPALPDPTGDTGGAATTDDPGTNPPPTPMGSGCTFDPALPDAAQQVRVSADGVLWVSSGDELYRYTATDDGSACTMSGARVWENVSFDDVTDFELDAAGNAYLLVFFRRIEKINADGTVVGLTGCDTFDAKQGHAIAVNPAGDRVWTVPIGADRLEWTDLANDACAPSETGYDLANSISTSPAFDGAEIVVNYHDPGAELPPGVVLDPADGSEVRQIGGANETGDLSGGIADIAPTANGYWVAGGLGDLWFVEKMGAIAQRLDARVLTGTPEEETISIKSVAYSATGPDYVAASFLDRRGVWRVDLAD